MNIFWRPKKCIGCGGKMFKKNIEYEALWGDSTKVVIPTVMYVCSHCNQGYFTSKEAQRVLKIAEEASRTKGGKLSEGRR